MKIQFTLAAALLAATTSAYAVPRYKIVDLGVPAGLTGSSARAIANSGAIAGEANVNSGANIGYRMDDGLTPLPTLSGGINFVVRGVNDAGVVAATVQEGFGIHDRAVLGNVGGVVQLGSVVGFAAAGALDVNNSNVAVGFALIVGTLNGIEGSLPLLPNTDRRQRAAVWTGGVGTELAAAPGSVNSVAVAINDVGEVAGMYRLASGLTQGVIWSGGVSSTLLLPAGQSQARVRAISESG